MPDFRPECPRCHSKKLKEVEVRDRYAPDVSRIDSPPTSTVFAYKCECGLSFTLEVYHGKKKSGKPKSGN